MKDIYPVTIIKSRYGGVYEGAPWVAFNEHPNTDTLEGAEGDDVGCSAFFDMMNNPQIDVNNFFGKKIHVGRGNTPQEAYEDLAKKLTP